MKENKIGAAAVRILQGDITTCDVEAIANVTGKTLVPHDAAEDIEPIHLDLQLWQGENKDKEIIITPGDNTNAEYILNTLSIETTATAGANKIRKTMRSIVTEAQTQGLESLAIPAIGTGVGKFSVERCAEILLEELSKSVAQKDNCIQRVIFVLDNQKSYKIFEQVLSNFQIPEAK